MDDLAYNSILQNKFSYWQIISKNLEVPNRITKKLRKNQENTVKQEKYSKMVNISLGFDQNAPELLAHNDLSMIKMS